MQYDVEKRTEQILHQALVAVSTSRSAHFFAQIQYEADYFDVDDFLSEAKEEQDCFERYIVAVEKGEGTSAIQDGLSRYRETMQGRLASSFHQDHTDTWAHELSRCRSFAERPLFRLDSLNLWSSSTNGAATPYRFR